MMNKIKTISESMGLGSDISEIPDKTGDETDTHGRLPVPTDNGGDIKAKNRTALIRALMPYLSESRREKADMLLKLINLMDLKKLI